MLRTSLTIVRDTLIMTVAFSAVGVVFNALREDGIPLFADHPYEIFIPCPEPLGEVGVMDPDDDAIGDRRTILVDARLEEDYDAWHHSNARRVTYDYLDPIPDEVLSTLTREFAGTGAARVVVYGDGVGEIGDTGYELARELAGRGLKNVFVVRGGASALKERSND